MVQPKYEQGELILCIVCNELIVDEDVVEHWSAHELKAV